MDKKDRDYEEKLKHYEELQKELEELKKEYGEEAINKILEEENDTSSTDDNQQEKWVYTKPNFSNENQNGNTFSQMSDDIAESIKNISDSMKNLNIDEKIHETQESLSSTFNSYSKPKRILIYVIIIFVILFMITRCVARTSNKARSTSNNVSETRDEEEFDDDEEETTNEDNQEDKEKTKELIKIGTPIELEDGYTAKVTGITTQKTIDKKEWSDETTTYNAKGTYLLVNMEYSNQSEDSVQFSDYNMYVLANGTKYPVLDDFVTLQSSIDGEEDYIQNINIGEAIQARFVFDLPDDVVNSTDNKIVFNNPNSYDNDDKITVQLTK